MKAKTAERGYGAGHQALRRAWRPYVEAGLVDCARCGRRILPGQSWHLDHDDWDRRRYLGPSHVRCNVTAPHQKRANPQPRPVTRW